jgi:hypothetical protein
VCEGFPALCRDRINSGYDSGVSGDIQQAGQVIPEIPEKIQTGKAGGYNGDQHHDRNKKFHSSNFFMLLFSFYNRPGTGLPVY